MNLVCIATEDYKDVAAVRSDWYPITLSTSKEFCIVYLSIFLAEYRGIAPLTGR